MVRRILRSRLLRRLAKQTEGCKRVPEPLQGAIKTYLEDFPNHQLRQHVFNLSLMLSGRPDDGPKTGMVAYQAPEKIMSAVEDYLTRRGPFAPVPKRFSSRRTRPKYDEKQVAAYVAARMPSVYSVVHNVFSEIRRRLPDFSPVSVLDYGSGPGTSLWALSQVWPGCVKQVNMVETSPSMLAASKKILQDLEEAPAMYNYKSLRVLTTKTRHSGHDIVIACYAIGELPTVSDQITAARQLWSLTRDLLVIIEPGTSEGSLTVRGIRAHILAIERKKLRRRRMFLTGSDPENVPLIGAAEEKVETNGIQAIKDRMKVEASLKSSRAGAHVVAPCPHDGVCPLDGTDQFCHFVQRLERTLTQRVAKKHSKAMLRGYEDEKYSYVVLRRGMRPRSKWPLDNVKLQLDIEEEPVNELLVDYEEFDLETSDEEDAEEGEDEENEGEEEEGEREEGKETEEHEEADKLEEAKADESEADDKVDEDYKRGGGTTEEDSGEHDQQVDRESEADSSDKEGVDIVAEEEAGESDNEVEDCVSSEEDDGELEESTEAVANMSSGWGRVIFKPYRRGKHVTLDVCRATERDGSSGSFDRLTVTRAKHRVLHREAKKVRWGDLWAFTSSRRTFRDNRDNRIPLCKRRSSDLHEVAST